MRHPAWTLIIVGLIIAGAGLMWLFGSSIPGLGRLPGDITIERGNFRLYLPVATCAVLSAALTSVLWLVRHFMR
jgi:hypothetical protein